MIPIPAPARLIRPTAVPNHRRRSAGFTLVEVIVAAALLAIVMTTATGTLVLLARAMDGTRGNPTTRAVAARSASDRLVDDLKVATAITEQTATSVAMTVPDRIGNGQPETLRYAWSGVPGEPLTLTLNGGPAQVIARDVRAFNLKYLTRTVGKPPPSESGEQLLVVHDASNGLKTYAVSSTAWGAEYLLPAFPPTTASWKITRIKVQMKRAPKNSTGTMTLQVRPADAAKKPTTAVLAATGIDITTVPTNNAWIEFPFTGLSGLNPAQGLCLVMTTSAPSSPGMLSYDPASSDVSIAGTSSTDNGASWTTPTDTSALQFYVYGTYTTQ